MNVYTVHLKGAPDDLAALERAIFVREGFSWAALVFGPAWLLWNRLWLPFLVWLVADAGLLTWATLSSPAAFSVTGLHVLMHLALAFEAAPLRRASLGRRQYQAVGVVHGRRIGDAECAYFARRGALPPIASLDHVVAGRPRTASMVGLFPTAGA